MNNFLGFVFAKGMGDERPEPDKRLHLSYGEVDSQFYGDTVTGGTIPSVSLPWEILETAVFSGNHPFWVQLRGKIEVFNNNRDLDLRIHT